MFGAAKPGTFDLTSSRMFIESAGLHVKLIALLDMYLPDASVALPDGRSVRLALAVRILLQNMFEMHAVWRFKQALGNTQLASYQFAVESFAKASHAIGNLINSNSTWRQTIWRIALAGKGLGGAEMEGNGLDSLDS